MTGRSFAARYREGLREFVEERSERRLRTAYELGRAAVQSKLSVLDVAVEHTEALISIMEGRRTEAHLDVVEAAGVFLVESLAAFEMVQRGVTEARRTAFEERRRARMLRELSSVLADATVASVASESVGELAQLVAEITREATGAAKAGVVLRTSWASREVTAAAEETDADTWSELLQPEHAEPNRDEDAVAETVTETLRSLEGQDVGVLEVTSPAGVPFGRDDRATLTQIAEMTAAWLERAQRRA